MSSRFVTRIKEIWLKLVGSAWFAYISILLLQIKPIWDIWRFKDLTNGDTAFYYTNAFQWNNFGKVSFAWSPIYTAFYGTVVKFFSDAVAATWIHRVIIVLVLAVLVLKLMRRLLPPGLAWIMAAWWVILPINFDSLYEVHLFAAIPALIACIVASQKPSVWTRGIVLGLFTLATILVRNELSIATGLWVLACVVTEIRLIRSGVHPPLKVYIAAYLTPLILVAVATAFFFIHSTVQGKALQNVFGQKHTVNVCQIYAYGYQQRNDDWHLDPWTQCNDLMKRDFGIEYPTLLETIRINPQAMLSHFLWNIRLIPDGLQVLLFNMTSGNLNPDYASVAINQRPALLGGIILILVVVIGLVLLIRQRGKWWSEWLAERHLGWVAMFCTGVTVVVIMLIQRPRPSYMFNLSFLIMATFGMCAFVIAKRLNKVEWINRAIPVIALALLIIVPHYFHEQDSRKYSLSEDYTDARPFAHLLIGKNVLLARDHYQFCAYVDGIECRTTDYNAFASDNPQKLSFGEWLDEKKVDVLYVDKVTYPSFQAYLSQLDPQKWQIIVNYQTPQKQWMLLTRNTHSQVG